MKVLFASLKPLASPEELHQPFPKHRLVMILSILLLMVVTIATLITKVGTSSIFTHSALHRELPFA